MKKKRHIPFFNYPSLYLSNKEEILAVMEDVMERGAYILQKDLVALEKHLAEFLNVKHVFGVADGTNALIIALRACGIGQGDEVIVPSHTYIASVAAIHFVGGTPVLVECGKDHMVDPASVENSITKKTKALMPVQLNGRTCNMEKLQIIAGDNNLIIVEDSAQALGSKFKGKNAGTFGLAGTYSFYPAKVLGCFGDGGAIVTNDDNVARQVALLRDHGRDDDGEVVAWGTNSRLDNLQAAILDLKLKTYNNDIVKRREIANHYNNELKEIEGLYLPPPPDAESDHFDIYQNYEIESVYRDELRLFLEQNGVSTIIQWAGKAVHQFKGLGFKNVSLPFTEKMFTRCLMLPMNTTLTTDDVDFICQIIKRFFNKGV